MTSLYRTILLGGAAFALTTTAAIAQDAPPPVEDGKIEKVTVTARRTKENLQKVPGSVSAFSEKDLDRIGATDSPGLQGAVPNLNIVQGRGSSNATNIYIRGVGQPDALQTFDPAIGFYVDDVYYSRIRGTQFDLFDIERIEVLRGPQGTLYGKNTIGGALKVVTRRPDQEERGSLQLTVGDYGQFEGRAASSGGLTDTLAGGIAIFGATRDGYVTNPVTGEDYNDRNVWAGRVQLAWDPSETFSVDFSADYADEDNARHGTGDEHACQFRGRIADRHHSRIGTARVRFPCARHAGSPQQHCDDALGHVRQRRVGGERSVHAALYHRLPQP